MSPFPPITSLDYNLKTRFWSIHCSLKSVPYLPQISVSEHSQIPRYVGGVGKPGSQCHRLTIQASSQCGCSCLCFAPKAISVSALISIFKSLQSLTTESHWLCSWCWELWGKLCEPVSGWLPRYLRQPSPRFCVYVRCHARKLFKVCYFFWHYLKREAQLISAPGSPNSSGNLCQSWTCLPSDPCSYFALICMVSLLLLFVFSFRLWVTFFCFFTYLVIFLLDAGQCKYMM